VLGFTIRELLKDLVEPDKLQHWMENVVCPARLLQKLTNRLPDMDLELAHAMRALVHGDRLTFLATQAIAINDNIASVFVTTEKQEQRLKMLFKYHRLRLEFVGEHPVPYLAPV